MSPIPRGLDPAQGGTLVDRIRRRAREDGDRPLYTFLSDGEAESSTLSWGELDRRARALAMRIREEASPGDRALLLFPPGLKFVVAFFACLYAGVVAVPAYPPRGRRSLPRLLSILDDCRPAMALTTAALVRRVEGWSADRAALAEINLLAVDDAAEEREPEGWTAHRPAPDGVAFLQYTSGSTAVPKGVEVRHRNLMHNEELIRRAFGQDESSIVVSWLPVYHDMGLIGSVLQPLYSGGRAYLMSPVAFLQKPLRWLEAISRFRADTSGGPNFAYDLCVDRIGEEDRRRLDLSSWRVAFNGAEPIRAETLRRFADAFRASGFRERSFFPCYGLAEATLLVSGVDGGGPRVGRFATAGLERGVARSADGDEAGGSSELVASGRPREGLRVEVVDPESGRPCAGGMVGEVWVAGDSVAGGYWQRPEETAEAFGARLANGDGPFLRTGDLAFLADGELFVTGRLKDLIILRGRNLYPQDVERAAEEAHPALRRGVTAAFPLNVGGEERFAVVVEVEPRLRAEVDGREVLLAVRREVGSQVEAVPWEVVLAAPGEVPLTSSGKVRRRACRERYLAGHLEVVDRDRREAPGDATADPFLDRGSLLALPPQQRPGAVGADLARRVALRTSGARARHIGVPDPNASLPSLGLDSMVALELFHDLRTDLGVELELGHLLESSVGELAAEVVRRVEEGEPQTAAAPASEDPARGAGDHPLSHGQEGLWYLQRLAPDSAAYNVAAAAWISGDLDGAALERALDALARRHAALRTTFVAADGGAEAGGLAVQRVHRELPPEFARIDATGWSDGDVRSAFEARAACPFALDRGPLWRVALASREAGDHALLLVVHHAVADLWSMTVVLEELGQLYRREVGLPASPLPPPPPGYPAFARLQRRRMAGEPGGRLLDFWREVLGDPPLPETELPLDRPRPPVQGHRGAAVVWRPEGDLAEDLRGAAARLGTTPFTVLLAALHLVLGRYGDRDEAVVGTPASGRTGPELAGEVGYFVNPVVLRGRWSFRESFAGLVRRLAASVVAALEHQELPFRLLVEALQPHPDPSRHPLFQVLLAHQSAPGGSPVAAFALGVDGAWSDLGGLPLRAIPVETGASQFDLSLMTAAVGGRLIGSLRFDRDLFDEVTVEHVLGHLEVLLRAALEHPEDRVGNLPWLTAAEHQQVFVEWNAAAPQATGAPRCLHRAFFQRADARPDEVALVSGDEVWTRGELAARARRLAGRLVAEGVGAETRVAVLLDRSPELVVAILGVLAAGGAYVPLDPSYPASRLAFMLDDSGARLVISRRLEATRLQREETAVRRLLLDEEEEHGPVADPVDVDPACLAYVIYTSGSTGRPKGVGIPHGAASALVEWSGAYFTPAELSGVLAATSVCFDLSVFELFVPLSLGGVVVLAENALALADLPARHRVTLVNTVPSAAAELVAQGALPPSVTTVNLAGEPLSRALTDAVYGAGVERVCNLYGPSEDTTYSTASDVPGGVAAEPDVGRPLPGTRGWVLDRRGLPVPPGVAGELCLAGDKLARGYLGRAARTAAAFVPDPFGAAGGRLYRTGDRVRQERDGRLRFLGRFDHQVKLRGFRIELGEVESALAALDGVGEAVAVVQRRPSGDAALVAFLSAAGPEPPDPVILRRRLAERLPDYMLPSSLVVLEAIPRIANGKVDRRALQRREPVAAPGAAHGVPPRGPVEEVLADLFRELLGVERVWAEDDFFALGGHSLSAARLVNRLRDAFDVEIPLAELFRHSSVAALARRVEGSAERVLPPIRPRGEGVDPPLSAAQQRLWFLQRLEPGDASYNVCVAVRLTGALDPATLGGALADVATRHEVLRSRFPMRGEAPVQVVEPPRPLPMDRVDLTALPRGLRQGEVVRLARQRIARPFRLDQGTLVRVVLVRLDPLHHVLVVVTHHLVSDGWSTGLFVRDLGSAYEARRTGRPGLPPLPVQYGDYALWQRRWLSGDAVREQVDHWCRQLAGASPELELPHDRPRTAAAAGGGGLSVRRSWPRRRVGLLEALGRDRRSTPFMVLAAGVLALFHRYAGQDDLSLGTPVSHRRRRELEELIGFFTNTLVLRVRVQGGLDFAGLLDQVRKVALDAYAHQDVPFERLVEELQPPRRAGLHPLFQALLALQDFPVEERRLEDLHLEPVDLDVDAARFDLALFVVPGDGGMKVVARADRSLFDRVTVVRLLDHLESLLDAALADPARRLDQLPLLGRGEVRQLIHDWGRGAGDGGPEEGLDRISALVERHGGTVRVTCGDRSLDGRELVAAARRLAHHLRSRGVRPLDRVALCLPRSLEVVTAILAVLECGAAWVPLDPEDGEERLDLLVRDSGVRHVVTRSDAAGGLPPGPSRIVLDREAEAIAAAPDSPLGVAADGGDEAYVMYTSGSTGRPKGVVARHGNLRHYLPVIRREVGLLPSDVYLHTAAFTFAASVRQLFLPLSTGCPVVVATKEELADALALLRCIERERVTVVDLVPSHWRALLDVADGGGEERRRSLRRSDLRRVLAASEPLPRELVVRWRHALGHPAPCFNLFGHTETAGITSVRRVDPAPEATGIASLGRARAGCGMYVLDRRLEPVPVGVVGEIAMAGVNVAGGYVGLPRLTAQRFVPDPYGEPGARLFLSGDLGRWRRDGVVEFLGRRDGQVKIRGFRVEPGEIEATAERHPAVAEAAVRIVRTDAGDPVPVVYLVAKAGREAPSTGELRSFLGRFLPPYMLPATRVVLDELPRTASGKRDRRALPPVAPSAQAAPAPPRTPVEETLCGLWGDLLAVPRVGIHDDFFELGGHSLLATRLHARMTSVFGVDLPLRDLFESTTVAVQAERLEAARARGLAPAAPPLEAVPGHDGREPSFAQERLWFLDRLTAGRAAYNLPYFAALTGGLAALALEQALGEVVRRHEVLRTTLPAAEDGRPRQRIHPPSPLRGRAVDLSGLPVWEARREAQRLARLEAARPFDLDQGPLLRVGLLRLSRGEHRLLLSVHHAASDAWSRGLLIAELGALYRAYRRGLPSPLQEPVLQYADFAAWQRGWLQGEVLEGLLAAWRQALVRSREPLTLPVDRPRREVSRHRGGVLPVHLARTVAGRVEDRARRTGTTPFMVLLAAFQVLLHRYSGSSRVPVGTPVANRTRAETETLLGCFVNTLVLETPVHGREGFGQLLETVREVTLDAFSRQDLPFEKLVEAFGGERDSAPPPLFQVTFQLRNTPLPDLDLDGLQVRAADVHGGTAKFDMGLALEERDGALVGRLEYDSDLFDATTARRMVAHFQVLLAAALDDSAARVAELPLMSAAELHQVRVEGNDTAAPAPAETVVAAVARQAGRTPDRIAVEGGGRQLTYGELERRADRLARRLVAAGAVRGRVLLVVDRTPASLVALLAAWKAGAAWVPVEPIPPEERRRFVVSDCAARLALVPSGIRVDLPPALPVVVVEDLLEEEAAGGAPPAVLPEDVAYVLYTSGSTGRPKGTAVPHHALANLEAALQEAVYGGPSRRVGLSASLAFDASVKQVLRLARGDTLVMVPEDVRFEGAALGRWLVAHQVDVLDVTPSQLDLLLAQGGSLPSCLLVGGEAVGEGAWRRLAAQPEVRAFNVYGPTECTVDATVAPVAGPTPVLGRTLRNVRSHVVDRHGEVLPVGVAGELVIGGAGVSHGYPGRPALTAQRFVPDPRPLVPGDRLYRTGDRAARRADGRLVFLGRVDHQVKLRGLRIEPGEVEAAVADHPGVERVVVGVRRGPSGGDVLVAWWTASGTGPVDAGAMARELGERAARRLPRAMVPAVWVLLDELRRTAAGKIDRAALPDPDWGGTRGRSGRGPASADEEAMAELWRSLLGIGEVAAEDDFFGRGGHSLLAAQLVSRIRRIFAVELPLRAVFEAPSLAALTERVAEARQGAAGAPAPPIGPAPEGVPLPLALPQRRLWFLTQLEPDSPYYNLPRALRLEGELAPACLEQVLSEVVRRHRVLRSRISNLDGEPVQRVKPAAPFLLPVVDLGGLEAADREAAAHRLARESALRPFDLEAGDPVRWRLLRRGDADHTLSMVLHHVVSDAWSSRLLVREVGSLYRSFASGDPSPLPEPSLQYGDYAFWQQGWLDSGEAQRQLDYWRHRLAGVPEVLELPTDRPRPAVQGFRGGRLERALPERTVCAVRDAARQLRATPFVFLLAVFQVLVHRYTGSTDLPVGSPVAGRNREELEGMLGLFVNTVVMRGDLSGAPSTAAVVDRLGDVVLGALAHQEVPFERLVDELAVRRSTGWTPLFQVAFQLQTAALDHLDLPGVRARLEAEEATTSKFDLTLSVLESEQGLRTSFEYNTDLFDGATVQRLQRHFETLLDGAVEDPSRPVRELPLLPPPQRHQVVFACNDAAAAYPRQTSVVEVFAHQVERWPHRVAVDHRGEQLTYGELDRRSNRLARHLRALGVGPEVPVALLVPRSAEMVVAMLAILKAGGSYLPLDASYPAPRLAWMLEDSAAPVLVTVSGLADRVPAKGIARVALDVDAATIHARDEGPLPPQAGPDSLAYGIYTSGSTGRPKAIGIPHRAINRLVLNNDYVRLGPSSRVGQASNSSFDAATFEIWGPLLTGGCIVGVDRDSTLSAPHLAAKLVRHGIDTLFLTTALFNQLAAEAPATFGALDQLLFGGEQVHPRRVAEVRKAAPGLRLLHVYGPTESTTFATFHRVDRVDEAGTVPIGWPIRNTAVHVVDRRLEPLAPVLEGELVVAGDGLARGYLGRPGLTAERFVPDPLGDRPGGRLYRTGDLVRRRHDGAIEFVGRIDFQVKLRGFRIELGEIESVLLEHPAVSEAVVVLRRSEAVGKSLAAYLVPAESAAPAPEELRAALAARLPEFMVPSSFTVLPALPLTPNGKVDRRALPEPEAPAAASATALRTPTQEMVAGAWCEVLGIERVGLEDNFFDLGGHSLLATRVVSRLRQLFGVELPLRLLFEHPTVAGLSRCLEDSGGMAGAPIVRVPRDGELPLSFAQQRLWFLHRLDPQSSLYNVAACLELEGSLHAAALAAALDELVRRHEVLRTSFPDRDGDPVQHVAPPRPLPLPRVDLSVLQPRDRESLSERLPLQAAERPFDLAEGHPLRVRLLRVAPDRHLLVLTVHHIASDGWSMGVLVRELVALYREYRQGMPSPLAELPLQYADFAHWQRRVLSGPLLERQLEYWRRRLPGLEELKLPEEQPRDGRAAGRGARASFLLPAELGRELEALSRRCGATLFMTLLAGFKAFLSRSTGQADVTVGSAVANRNRAEVEGLIGFFVNMLVLRTDLSGNPSFLALVERIRETCLGAYAHQDVPYERLVEVLRPGRSSPGAPLVRAAFGLQNAPGADLDVEGLAFRSRQLERQAARFDLTVWVHPREDGLRLLWTYDTAIYDATTIARLQDRYRTLLEGAVAEPSRTLDRLQLVPDEELRQRSAERERWRSDVAGGLLAGRKRRTVVRATVPASDEGGDTP